MKKGILFFFLSLALIATAQNDQELNRDSVVSWQYVSNPPNTKASYKPIKSQYAGGAAYSVWQQQATDILIRWIQQSYLPRGLVMRTIAKNDQRWTLDENGPLHSYGVDFLGYSTSFRNGKIDLHCCEQGQRLVAGFNDFPGSCIKGFNPAGLYFFAEQAQFATGDTEAELSGEGIDKKIQPSLYRYRTYVAHYHDNGFLVFKLGVVVPKKGEWPFKPVLVKDAVAYINQQLADYPGILQKNPYSVKEVQAALERLKPYYNEVAKLKNNTNYNNSINDGNDHFLLDPRDIINGNKGSKTFPEYKILVSTGQQTIDETKKDNPLWVYFNLTPRSVTLQGNPAKIDTKFGTGVPHMINSLLRNFNFDYVSDWLAQPEKMKAVAYTPLDAPVKSSGNLVSGPATISATGSAKNKDPYTILYEDFDGYAPGVLSAKNWHTYGRNGHSFENATVTALSGQSGKWVAIPDPYTFYPDFNKPLGSSFTVNYDVYFGSAITNTRTPLHFRLEAKDPKKSNPIDLHDINREGFQFSMAMSGETETSKRFMSESYAEVIGKVRIPAFKAGDVARVSIAVNGPAVIVSVNGKELMRDDKVLSAGKTFKRCGWYSGVPALLLGNIYVKSSSPVQNSPVKEPPLTGVVKDKNSVPDVPSFETTDYAFKPLTKIDAMPPVAYPAGFKSTMPALAEGTNKAVAVLPAFKAPERSALLNTLPATVMTNTAFKKYIDDLKTVVGAKLNADNTNKIDSYLKTKKVSASKAISNEAVGAWLKAKPTVALYLFCKALQADYTDMNTANNLASFLNAYGYSEKAIPVLQYINSTVNGSPEVLANMATAYYNLGDMDNALIFADKSIAKDSLNAGGNKVAAFVRLNKAAQTNNKTEADKAIGCLKQSLKGQYDKEASDLLANVEGNHQKLDDFANTNFKEFPLLRRLELPAMPEDLSQAKSFNEFLEKEKRALSQTADNIRAAYRKIPEQDMKQLVGSINQNKGLAMMMVKAGSIINHSGAWYMKMKADLEQLFLQEKKVLGTAYGKKISAITKKYAERLNKLEGGEGRGDEEEEIERLKKARCEEYNKESAEYLPALAKLTNQFAQRSELVSRTYFRDYANWMPVQLNDNSNRYFLDAQAKYITDIMKILSLYTVTEPCIYPSVPTKDDKAPAKPKQWDDKYCPAILNQTIKLGAAGIQSGCTSFSIEGGEGVLGELTVNYNEDGTFKDITLGMGLGAEAGVGITGASASVGASAKEYITIGASPSGGIQVTDWGAKGGVSAAGNIGPVSGELNIASTTISVSSGVSASGVVANALGLGK